MKDDDLMLETAEIIFYNADGKEGTWPATDKEVEMLSWIRAADLRSGIADRRFSIRSRDLAVSFVQDHVPFNFFLRMDELSPSGRFDIERLQVENCLWLEKDEGAYIINRTM